MAESETISSDRMTVTTPSCRQQAGSFTQVPMELDVDHTLTVTSPTQPHTAPPEAFVSGASFMKTTLPSNSYPFHRFQKDALTENHWTHDSASNNQLIVKSQKEATHSAIIQHSAPHRDDIAYPQFDAHPLLETELPSCVTSQHPTTITTTTSATASMDHDYEHGSTLNSWETLPSKGHSQKRHITATTTNSVPYDLRPKKKRKAVDNSGHGGGSSSRRGSPRRATSSDTLSPKASYSFPTHYARTSSSSPWDMLTRNTTFQTSKTFSNIHDASSSNATSDGSGIQFRIQLMHEKERSEQQSQLSLPLEATEETVEQQWRQRQWIRLIGHYFNFARFCWKPSLLWDIKPSSETLAAHHVKKHYARRRHPSAALEPTVSGGTFVPQAASLGLLKTTTPAEHQLLSAITRGVLTEHPTASLLSSSGSQLSPSDSTTRMSLQLSIFDICRRLPHDALVSVLKTLEVPDPYLGTLKQGTPPITDPAVLLLGKALAVPSLHQPIMFTVVQQESETEFIVNVSADQLRLLTSDTKRNCKKTTTRAAKRDSIRSSLRNGTSSTTAEPSSSFNQETHDQAPNTQKCTSAVLVHRPDALVPEGPRPGDTKRAGRPRVNRSGCRCLICSTLQTPQWRFMNLFDDLWMDLVCNACYMKFNGSRPANGCRQSRSSSLLLPDVTLLEKPPRPTLSEYKEKGPCAYPHLMRRTDSKQHGITKREKVASMSISGSCTGKGNTALGVAKSLLRSTKSNEVEQEKTLHDNCSNHNPPHHDPGSEQKDIHHQEPHAGRNVSEQLTPALQNVTASLFEASRCNVWRPMPYRPGNVGLEANGWGAIAASYPPSTSTTPTAGVQNCCPSLTRSFLNDPTVGWLPPSFHPYDIQQTLPRTYIPCQTQGHPTVPATTPTTAPAVQVGAPIT